MFKVIAWAVLTKRESELLERGEKRLELAAKAGPLTRAEILAGLDRGPEDKPVKSVLAIVKGLKEMAVKELANAALTPHAAEVLRGRLGFANDVVEMLGKCWQDIERTRRAEEREEKK